MQKNKKKQQLDIQRTNFLLQQPREIGEKKLKQKHTPNDKKQNRTIKAFAI